MPSFSNINPEAPSEVKRRYARENANFFRKFDKAVGKLKLSKHQLSVLADIAGTASDSCNLLASNRLGRDALVSRMVDACVSEFLAHPERPHYFVTILSGGWNCTNFDTYIDHAEIQRVIRKVIDAMKVEAAIGMIEIQAMGRDEGNGVRTIFPNVHLLVRAEPGFQPRVMSNALSERFGLKPYMGAKPVKISDRIKTPEDVSRIVNYMGKLPGTGKFAVLTKSGPRYRNTTTGMHQSIVLRLVEILSHFTLNDFLISSGAWTSLRRRLMKDVRLSDDFQRSRVKPSGPRCAAQFWISIPRIDPAAGCPVYVRRAQAKSQPSQPAQIDFRRTEAEKREERASNARRRRAKERKARRFARQHDRVAKTGRTRRRKS